MKSLFFWRRRPESATLRALHPSDAAACAGLHRASFAHSWSGPEFEALLIDPACAGEAIETASGLVGFVLSRRALDEAEILTIVVDLRQRRGGFGQRLLSTHLSRLASMGVQKLFLEVDEQNGAALALYRRQGFIEKGTRKGYYQMPDGTRANALIMVRVLT